MELNRALHFERIKKMKDTMNYAQIGQILDKEGVEIGGKSPVSKGVCVSLFMRENGFCLMNKNSKKTNTENFEKENQTIATMKAIINAEGISSKQKILIIQGMLI